MTIFGNDFILLCLSIYNADIGLKFVSNMENGSTKDWTTALVEEGVKSPPASVRHRRDGGEASIALEIGEFHLAANRIISRTFAGS